MNAGVLAAVWALCGLGAASPDAARDAAREAAVDVGAALACAIDDERHAIAFYRAVMAAYGERPPFSNIIRAERRHEAALVGQFERLGIDVPEDEWEGRAFDVSGGFAAMCDASVVAEVRNGKIYDGLIADCTDPEVRAVFERLRDASIERHLPAFRRNGSGWATVTGEALDAGQRAQRDAAEGARSALFGSLFGELSAALASGGAESAIGVCATRAPAIAEKVGTEFGVEIGRTSFRLRNPENTAPVWAELAIDERAEEQAVFADRSGRLGVLTPIRLAGSCLQCHGSGDEVSAGMRAALEGRYPEDRATGFTEGDLRGWFWVEVPAGGSAGDKDD